MQFVKNVILKSHFCVKQNNFKMNKSTIRLLFILMALVIFTLFALFMKNQTSKQFDAANFKIDNVNKISKITITHNKQTLTLSKTNNNWLVNEKYAIRPHLLEQIVEVFETAEVKNPVAKAAQTNVIKALISDAKVVDVYTKNESEPAKTYYIGTSNKDGSATYMVQKVGDKIGEIPYEIVLPGFRGYVTNRFSTDINEWRTKTILNYDKLTELNVQYHDPKLIKHSFLIKANSADVLTPNGEKIADAQGNSAKINEYLNAKHTYYLEAYENHYYNIDSIKQTMPLATVTTKGLAGKTETSNTVNVYYMPVHEGSSSMLIDENNKRKYDPDAYFAHINNQQDWVIIQKTSWNKLLLSWENFTK